VRTHVPLAQTSVRPQADGFARLSSILIANRSTFAELLFVVGFDRGIEQNLLELTRLASGLLSRR
jgi:hypothetical protein